MKTVPVSELSGAELDWAVAKAEGLAVHISPAPAKEIFRAAETLIADVDGFIYRPTIDWWIAGPIIERERMTIARSPEKWGAGIDEREDDYEFIGYGDTPLIAAMRCYVASKFGDTVEVPAVLVEGE